MAKRMLSLYMLIICCFMALMLRIAYINFSGYYSAAQTQTKRTLIIGSTRGKIYDRNMNPLVDRESDMIAAVTPIVGSFEFLKGYSEFYKVQEKIEKGYPFTVKVNEKIDNEFIRTFSVPVRYSGENIATHLIGYVDSSGKNGVTGIEKTYDALLKKYSGTLSVTFEADAKGRVLLGMDKYINDNSFNSKGGVVLTLDEDIQRIVEQELEKSTIKSGCAVVMHVNSGEIYALASVPDFDPENIADYMSVENSPFINKALRSYSAGSVFKPILSAAALENGYDGSEEYECTGSIAVGDRTFNCYNNKAHGKVNLEAALQNSCNTYFINLIQNIDVDYLLKLCEDMGVGASDEIADGISTDTGKLPERDSLDLYGNLANFAFGQGELMMTPIQMAKAYHVLATGKYIAPTVIYGFSDSYGSVTEKGTGTPVPVLSQKTVMSLRSMLLSVTQEGNGQNAHSDIVGLAGKTGTAQSGIYKNGKEICRTWFAGFYPANNPHYIVVVMNEDGEGGSTDCAPVFRRICERIIHDP